MPLKKLFVSTEIMFQFSHPCAKKNNHMLQISILKRKKNQIETKFSIFSNGTSVGYLALVRKNYINYFRLNHSWVQSTNLGQEIRTFFKLLSFCEKWAIFSNSSFSPSESVTIQMNQFLAIFYLKCFCEVCFLNNIFHNSCSTIFLTQMFLHECRKIKKYVRNDRIEIGNFFNVLETGAVQNVSFSIEQNNVDESLPKIILRDFKNRYL